VETAVNKRKAIIRSVPLSKDASQLEAPGLGVMLLYAVNDPDEDRKIPTIGFSLNFPVGSARNVLVYSVHNDSLWDQVVVNDAATST
jgi:hypothetical protein